MQKTGWHTYNPAKGVETYSEHKDIRWLNDEELKSLWAVLEEYGDQSVANAIHLLLLTGSRRKEVLQATWGQFGRF